MNNHDLHLRRIEGEAAIGSLFYIHGLGESSYCFESLCQHPGLRRWNHLIPDLAGYGSSAAADPPLTLEEHAASLAELLAIEHPKPMVVLGHSMGGAIGTILSQQAPDRVTAFVNVEGNISGQDCEHSGRIAAFDEAAWLSHGYSEFVEGLAENPSAAVATYVVSLRRCDPRTLYRNSCQLVEMSQREILAKHLAQLGRPVVFIHGAADGGQAEYSLEQLRDQGVEPRPIGAADHWPFIDQPDAFVAMLGAFLDGLGRRQSS